MMFNVRRIGSRTESDSFHQFYSTNREGPGIHPPPPPQQREYRIIEIYLTIHIDHREHRITEVYHPILID